MYNRNFGVPESGRDRLDFSSAVKASDYDAKYVDEITEDYVFLDIKAPCFAIGGIPHPDKNSGEYYRLDAAKRELYSETNAFLGEHTSGATVRFATDAEKVFIKIWLRSASTGFHHFTDRGAFGIDIYAGTGTERSYVGAAMQTFADSGEYNEGELTLPGGTEELLINLPLYAGISKMTIGFAPSARVCAPAHRTVRRPLAFYGSSITQGGCASRPGNAYINILARAVDADASSFGFSGSALGEQAIAEFIGSRELSVFIMDYDYNSPTPQTLADTHFPFYQTVRAMQPQLPIVLVTHPYYAPETENDRKRKSVIRKTYEMAKTAGDTKIWYCDSESFFPQEMRDLYAVDNLHPNDLGFFHMAKAIYPFLMQALASVGQ